MKRRIDWMSSLKTVRNEKTGDTRYYIYNCERWNRITEQAYTMREDDATRQDTLLTKIKGDLIHQFKTVYGTYYIGE